LAAIMLMPGFAFAQEVASTGVDEIVVTAQRRSESMQDVPIAITALQGDALIERGIVDTTDIAAVTPGLTTTTSLSRATPFIRGIGTAAADPGQEAGVATYVDGVYYASPQGNVFALNNIERIEVLKGPQGTLFGRNTTGGLIHIITRDPSTTPMLMGTVGYGKFDTFEGNLYGTTGLTDDLAVDLSLFTIDQNEGWGENFITGKEVNFRREWSVRTKLKWDPNDSTSVVASLDFQDNESDIGTNRNVYPRSRLLGNIPFRGSIYDAQGNVLNFVEQENWGGSVKINRDVGFADLQSLTAFRSTRGLTLYDQDSSPLSVADTRLNEHQKTYQQEFLLNGSTSRLKWTTGVFFYRADSDLILSVRSQTVPSLRFDLTSNMRTISLSGFAEGAYELSDRTTLTLGARYTSDKRTIYGKRVATEGNITGTPQAAGTVLQTTDDAIPNDETFEEPTWRLSLDHRFNDRLLAYGSYSRGFKSGIFTQTNPFSPPVDPETIDAYEIGAKSDLLGGRLRMNFAVFRYDHKDIQLSQSRAGATQLFNAAKGRVWGADAEITSVPYDGVGRLEVTVGLSVLDTEYTSFPNAPIFVANPTGGNIQVPCPLEDTPECSAKGHEIIRSPDFTSNVGVRYSVPVGGLNLTSGVLWYHNDGFYWEVDNRIKQPAYDVVNVQLGLGSVDERWEVRVFARNLLEEEYYQAHGISTLGDVFIPAPPRTYGVAVSFKFGG
jgi:iron complex outermembrane receptor protein